MIQPSILVVLDGLPNAGTSTQVDAVADDPALSTNTVVKISAPTDGPLALAIRNAQASEPFDPCAASVLFAIDRVSDIDAQVAAALENGAVILCDRYTLTELASECLPCIAQWLESSSIIGRDAITIYLDVPPDPGDEDIADNFTDLLASHSSVYVVDGTQQQSAVTADIVALLPVVT